MAMQHAAVLMQSQNDTIVPQCGSVYRLPLHYGGRLHTRGRFYMGSTVGSIQVAPANNIGAKVAEGHFSSAKKVQQHRLHLQNTVERKQKLHFWPQKSLKKTLAFVKILIKIERKWREMRPTSPAAV